MFKIEEINGKSSVSFCCFDDEFSGVKKIAQKVCLDVERVTGKKPCLEETDNISSEVLKSKVFFATISNPAGKNLEKIEKISYYIEYYVTY